jgi:hypothetical protein
MPAGGSTSTGCEKPSANSTGRPSAHAVTGADDLEALGVALGDADDVVVDERAGQAVQRTRLALVVGTGDQNLVLLDLDLDGLGHGERELALRALDRDILAVDRNGHAGGDVDGKTSDTRHVRSPHVGEDFPTHALLLCLTVGEKTGGGGQDRDAQAAEDLGDLGRACVHADRASRRA